MRPAQILALQRRQPFEVLRIQLSDRQSYEVRHPEMMAVTETTVFICLDPGPDGVPKRSVYCDPRHITQVEPLRDGRKPRRRTGRKT
jgi:hypothetical protein